MSNQATSSQAGKVPDTIVVIAGQVWPDFARWSKSEGLILREIATGDEAEGVFLKLERRSDHGDQDREVVA